MKRLSRSLVALCGLALMLAFTACDKDATRDDEQPTATPTSAPADDMAKKEAPSKEEPKMAEAAPVDHAKFDILLKKYVSPEGLVKYKEWKASADDLEALDAYLASVGAQDISGFDEKEKLAFWINGYNALAVKGILDAYPVDSVMKITGLEDGKFFKEPKYKIAKMELSLDQIENEKIRKDFAEPRIHFVLNCTALSCPKLRQNAITKDNLDAEMDAAAKDYIIKDTQVDKKKRTVSASKIFEWFKGDFEKDGGSVNEFLAKYMDDAKLASVTRKAKKISHHEYDWALNEAK